MAFSKKQNTPKNNPKTSGNILPNQNNISAVLESYLHSVSDMDMIIRVISNSYLFENSYEITGADIKAYGYLFKNFSQVILDSLRDLHSITNSKYTKDFNLNRKEVNALFTFYTNLHEIMEDFIKDVSEGTNEKTIIAAITSISGAVDALFTAIDKIFKTLPSDENLVQLDNFIEKTFTMLDNIINNFATSIRLIFRRLGGIFMSARITKMFALNDIDAYAQIKENIIGVKDCLSELFSGILDNPELMAMEMGRLLFNQVTGIKYGKGAIMGSYVYVFDTLKWLFWAADDAAIPGIIAAKLKVWDILKEGIKGFKGVIDEIFGTGGTGKGLIPVITDDQLRLAFTKFTGIKYGRGATMDSFIYIFKTLRKIFIAAAKANIYATICDKTKAFENIKKGAKGIKGVIEALFGRGPRKKGFIPFLDDDQLKMAFTKFTGIRYGKGATMDLYSQIIVTLKSTFWKAIFTGNIAKLTIKLNTWENIKTAAKGLEEACSVKEESVWSVLKDKTLGINEIAITKFNTQLLIELRKAFFEAILTGFVAKTANKSWEFINKGVLNLRLLHFLAKEEGMVSYLKNKFFGINELSTARMQKWLLIELRKAFFEAILTGFVAKIALNTKSFKHINLTILRLVGFAMIMNILLLSSIVLYKNSDIIFEELKLIKEIIKTLLPIFTISIILGIVALPLKYLMIPILIALAALIAMVVCIRTIASIMNGMNKKDINVISEFLRLTVVFTILIVVFTILIALSIVTGLSIMSMGIIISALYVLGIISTQICIITAITNTGEQLKGIVKLIILISLLGVLFIVINKIGLIALLSTILMPFLMLALLGLTVIALEINMISNLINKHDPLLGMIKLTVIMGILWLTFQISNRTALLSIPFVFIMSSLMFALLGLTVIALEINMISNLINKHDPVLGIIRLTIVMGLLWVTFKTVNIIALLSLAFLFIMPALMLALLGLTVIALEINMISNLINSQDTVKAQIKLAIIVTFLSIAMFELLALSLFAGYLIFRMPVLALAIIGIISLVLLMCLIIVPDFLRNTFINLNIVFALLLITGGVLILVNKVFELANIGKVILNVLALIGLVFVLTLLFTASLFLVPFILSSSLVLATFLVAITAVLVMALALKGVELINLDRNKIEENIRTITDSIRSIIGLMTESPDDAPTINEDVWAKDKLLSLILAVPAFALGLICISAMLLIAAELWLLEKFNLNADKIGYNLDTINTSLNKIVMFLKTDYEGLNVLDIEVWKNDKLVAMFLMAPVIFSAMIVISMLILVAAELWILEKIKIDDEKIIKNIDTILGSINLILAKLFNKDGIYKLEKDENDSGIKIFGKNMANMFTESFARLNPIIDMILAVPMLVISIIVVGLVLLLARNLKKITRINFTEKDKTRISDNITLIFDTIKSINETLNAPHIQQKPAGGEDKSWWEKALDGIISVGGNVGSRIKDLVKGIMNTGTLALAFINTSMLSAMVEHLNTIATFELKATDITGKTKEIIDVCNLVAIQLNKAKIAKVNPRKFEKVTSVIKMLSDSVTNLMNINTNQENVTPEGQIDFCLKPFINLTQFIDGTYKINGEEYTGFSKLDVDGGWFDSGPYGKFKKLISIEDLLIESGKKLQELTLDETKVDTIVACLLKPIQKIINEVKDNQLTDEDIKKVEKYSTITSELIETTRKLSTMNSVNFENYSKNIVAFIENIHKNKSADFSALDTLVTHLTDMNKTTSKLEPSKFGNYVKLFKDSNLINVSKIQTLKDNLKEITEYSKNMSDNFDKLSTVLSDKLVVVLEKMKTTLESLSGFETNIKVEEQKPVPQQTTVDYADLKSKQMLYLGKENIEANLDRMIQFERIKEQNINEIRDTLDEISLILRNVKENTERI